MKKTRMRALVLLGTILSAASVPAASAGEPQTLKFSGSAADLESLLDNAPAGAVVVCEQTEPLVVAKTIRITRPISLRGLKARLPDKLGNTPLLVVEARGVTLADLELHGNYDSVSQDDRAPLIHIKAGEFCVERCKFVDGSKDGIMVTPDDGAGDIVGGVIRDIEGTRMGRDLVSLSGGCGGQRIRNMTVENVRLKKGYFRGAVEVSDGSDWVTVRHVRAEDAVYAIDVQDHGASQAGKPAPSAPNTKITIEDVTAIGCKHVIRTANHPLGHSNLTLRDFTAEDCRDPVLIANTAHVRIENLTIVNKTELKKPPVTLRNCDDVTLRNVTVTGLAKGVKTLASPGSTNVKTVGAKPDLAIIQSPAELKERIKTQLYVTRPDYVVFVPEVTDDRVSDTGNEHFLVFDGPDGSLMAIWTQSTSEGQPDQHIVFVQSLDEGRTWSRPRIIAGPSKAGKGLMASWAFPLVSRSGRIYVLYSQHVGKFDTFPHTTGRLDGIYSDDQGRTWSAPQTVKQPHNIRDNPDTSFPGNWICWQKPQRLTNDGRYLAGVTRWTSLAVKKNPTGSWISHDSVVEFVRFENIDRDPQVGEIEITWLAANEKAITVPFPGHPETSACQEPSIVKLPDGRLFCVMRTSAGSPFWTASGDQGQTWSPAERLLRRDGGEPLMHPLSPCPIYDMAGNAAGSGRYALFIHNHDGHYQGYSPTDTSYHRRPVYLVPGRYQPGARQPVWFDEPRWFMDHDGVGLGPPKTRGRFDLALYASFTNREGTPVLWYPDRKFFLLGRVIGPEWFLPRPQ